MPVSNSAVFVGGGEKYFLPPNAKGTLATPVSTDYETYAIHMRRSNRIKNI